jgi:hypothetical protein
MKHNISLTTEELLILLSLVPNVQNNIGLDILFDKVSLNKDQLIFLIKQNQNLAKYILSKIDEDIDLWKIAINKYSFFSQNYKGTCFELLKYIVDRSSIDISHISQTEEICLYAIEKYNVHYLLHNPNETIQKAVIKKLIKELNDDNRSNILKTIEKLVKYSGYTIHDYIQKHLMLL